jgi:hypothetical protein
MVRLGRETQNIFEVLALYEKSIISLFNTRDVTFSKKSPFDTNLSQWILKPRTVCN